MTDARNAAANTDDQVPADEEAESKVQSLTDFFDQRDRAAFRRALAIRDAYREKLRQSRPGKG